MCLKPETLGGKLEATLATWAMALVIRAPSIATTQAIHAKLDEVCMRW